LTDDYSQRVEPSASGGKKMGKLLYDAIIMEKIIFDEKYSTIQLVNKIDR
jgi:hypothetical protein